MKWLSSVLGLMLIGSACKDVKEGFDRGFKQSFAKSFGESCTSGAVAEGAPQDKAKSLCDCAANYLVDHHDSVALTKLSATAESAESQQVIGTAVDACLGNTP